MNARMILSILRERGLTLIVPEDGVPRLRGNRSLVTPKLLAILKEFKLVLVESINPKVIHLAKPRSPDRTYYRVSIRQTVSEEIGQRIRDPTEWPPIYQSKIDEDASKETWMRLHSTYILQSIPGSVVDLFMHSQESGWVPLCSYMACGDDMDRSWIDLYTPGIPELERIYPMVRLHSPV